MSAFGGAQCLSLFFISYEPRTVNKTVDVRIVFSQHSLLAAPILCGARRDLALESGERVPGDTR